MCQALIEMLEDERREGEKIGERQGIKKTEDRHIRNLMESMNLTEEQAAAALKINRNHRLTSKRVGKKQNRKNGPGKI